jgi:hypothetical protein
MTAPANPAPLPVVACWIDPIPESQPAVFQHMYEDGDLPAVAVPLALFEDHWFRMAVYRRAEVDSIFTAIAAELRARAGVPETNFGNVGGADA